MPELGASSRTLNWDEFDNEQSERDMNDSKFTRDHYVDGRTRTAVELAATVGGVRHHDADPGRARDLAGHAELEPLGRQPAVRMMMRPMTPLPPA
jgi:hypothetical protein